MCNDAPQLWGSCRLGDTRSPSNLETEDTTQTHYYHVPQAQTRPIRQTTATYLPRQAGSCFTYTKADLLGT